MAKNPEDFALKAATSGDEVVTSANYRHIQSDPIIVVSALQFGFTVPRWDDRGRFPDTDDERSKVDPWSAESWTMQTEIGPTVLSSEVTSFALVDAKMGSYVAPPKASDRRWIMIHMTARNHLQMSPFIGEDGSPKPAEVEAMLLRAFEYAGHGGKGKYDPRQPERSRFLIGPGQTCPEVMAMRQSQIFETTRRGSAAVAMLLRTVMHCKSMAHLGAVHDFAVLAGATGFPVAEACRKRLAQVKR
jgi:hypothetical protein